MAAGSPEVSRERVREYLRDRQVVLLTATEAEAAPVLGGMEGVEKSFIVTKAFYTGELPVQVPAEGASISAGVQPLFGNAAAPAATPVRVVLAITGCDKTNTAHTLTCLLENMVPPPRLVVQAGIAGAFTTGAPSPAVGDIVLATHEAYADTGSSSPAGWLSATELGLPIYAPDGVETGAGFPLDVKLVRSAAAVVQALDWSALDVQKAGKAADARGTPLTPAVLLGPCVTSSRVTGLRVEAEVIASRWGALAESMEGAAAAHVCGLYRIPFVEIRGISNLVLDRDRASWRVEQAAALAGRAAVAVAAALDRLPL